MKKSDIKTKLSKSAFKDKLTKAVFDNDLVEVEQLFNGFSKRGGKDKAATKVKRVIDNERLLGQAILKSSVPMIKLLLEKGADVNICCLKFFSPLHLLVTHKKFTRDELRIFSMILDQPSVDPNRESLDPTGCTPLHLALVSENDLAVHLLLKNMETIPANEGKPTPLHLAVQSKDLEKGLKMAKLLFEKNPSQLTLKDSFFLTPLEHAIDQNNESMVEYFYSSPQGKDLITQLSPIPFINAVITGNPKIEALAMNPGFNIAAEETLSWEYWKKISDYLEKFLLRKAEEGLKLIIKAEKERGICLTSAGGGVMHYVVRAGNLTMAKKLCELGAPLDVENKSKQTPLYLAVLRGDDNLVEFLLNEGAKVDICNLHNMNLLHLVAVVQGDENILRTERQAPRKYSKTLQLLLKKAKKENLLQGMLEQTDADDNTPLILAGAFRNENLVRFFLENNAVIPDFLDDKEILEFLQAVQKQIPQKNTSAASTPPIKTQTLKKTITDLVDKIDGIKNALEKLKKDSLNNNRIRPAKLQKEVLQFHERLQTEERKLNNLKDTLEDKDISPVGQKKVRREAVEAVADGNSLVDEIQDYLNEKNKILQTSASSKTKKERQQIFPEEKKSTAVEFTSGSNESVAPVSSGSYDTLPDNEAAGREAADREILVMKTSLLQEPAAVKEEVSAGSEAAEKFSKEYYLSMATQTGGIPYRKAPLIADENPSRHSRKKNNPPKKNDPRATEDGLSRTRRQAKEAMKGCLDELKKGGPTEIITNALHYHLLVFCESLGLTNDSQGRALSATLIHQYQHINEEKLIELAEKLIKFVPEANDHEGEKCGALDLEALKSRLVNPDKFNAPTRPQLEEEFKNQLEVLQRALGKCESLEQFMRDPHIENAVRMILMKIGESLASYKRETKTRDESYKIQGLTNAFKESLDKFPYKDEGIVPYLIELRNEERHELNDGEQHLRSAEYEVKRPRDSEEIHEVAAFLLKQSKKNIPMAFAKFSTAASRSSLSFFRSNAAMPCSFSDIGQFIEMVKPKMKNLEKILRNPNMDFAFQCQRLSSFLKEIYDATHSCFLENGMRIKGFRIFEETLCNAGLGFDIFTQYSSAIGNSRQIMEIARTLDANRDKLEKVFENTCQKLKEFEAATASTTSGSLAK